MKQGFVSLYGRIIIERDVLYFRNPYLPFEKTAFAEIGIEVAWFSAFVLKLFWADTPMRLFVTIVFGLLILSRFPYMYDKLFKRSFASRIPLSAVRHYTVKEDHHGLQTEIKLQLNNGRYKKIIFRKLENQLESFIGVLPIDNVRLATA